MPRTQRLRAQEHRLRRQQAKELGALADVRVRGPSDRRGKQHSMWKDRLIGLTVRIEERQRRIDELAEARMATDGATARVAAAIVTFIGEHGEWTGEVAALMRLLPAGVAPSASYLSRRLNLAAPDLAAAGVVVERRRQAGTGARVLRLRLSEPSMPVLRRNVDAARAKPIAYRDPIEIVFGDAVALSRRQARP